MFIPLSNLREHKKFTRLFGCKKSDLPTKYLGMPLFMGHVKPSFWEGVLDRMDCKLNGWTSKVLTYVAWLSLIQTTLSSIPMYSACVFKIPIYIAKAIDIKCRRFIWNGTTEQNKFVLVKWDMVYKEKMIGGLGSWKMRIIG